jgi:5'-3' exoribonuclease 1
LKVIGYTRKGEKGWEYSDNAIALLNKYMNTFPQVFAALSGKGQIDYLKDTDIFDSEPKSNMSALKDWLKKEGVSNFVRVSLTSEALSKVSAYLSLGQCFEN